MSVETNENSVKENSTEPKKKKKLSKQQRNYIFYIILIVFVSALSIYYIVKNDFNEVIRIITKAKIGPILAMFGLVIISFIFEGLILTLFARLYKKKYHLYQGVFNGLIGVFFSDITPFASGGQFVQAYTFSKQGVKVANSASILVMHFIIYQTAIILYGAVAFIFGYENTIKLMGNINFFGILFSPISLSIVGFAINIFTILSLFVLAYCKPLHRFILNTGINLFAKLHLVKNPEQKRKDLTVKVATFRVELRRLMSNFGMLIAVIILMLLKMTLLNSLPYFAGLAMGEDLSGKYLQCLWSNSYLTMITCFIPIPGASGGAELAYQALFSHIYSSSAVLSASNLLWRGISYYFGLILGGIVFFSYHESPKKYAVLADTRTFIDLEIIALARSEKEASTYEMLSSRDAKIEQERKKGAKLLDAKAVKRSFNKINKLIQASEDSEKIDDGINEETYEKTKKYLKIVFEETQQQENISNSEVDEEITKELEKDRQALERSSSKEEDQNN